MLRYLMACSWVVVGALVPLCSGIAAAEDTLDFEVATTPPACNPPNCKCETQKIKDGGKGYRLDPERLNTSEKKEAYAKGILTSAMEMLRECFEAAGKDTFKTSTKCKLDCVKPGKDCEVRTDTLGSLSGFAVAFKEGTDMPDVCSEIKGLLEAKEVKIPKSSTEREYCNNWAKIMALVNEKINNAEGKWEGIQITQSGTSLVTKEAELAKKCNEEWPHNSGVRIVFTNGFCKKEEGCQTTASTPQ